MLFFGIHLEIKFEIAVDYLMPFFRFVKREFRDNKRLLFYEIVIIYNKTDTFLFYLLEKKFQNYH